MGGKALTRRELGAAALFVVVSSVAILAAWLAFGGTLPLQAKGYRVTIAFPSARTLVAGADVRVSGVPVGRVVAVRPGEDTTRATIELRRRYVPLASDARALVRTKTPLGESYVAITRGTAGAPPIPDGGRLRTTNVVPSQEIEDVLGVFDPRTRRAFRTAVTDGAAALRDRGEDLNQALGAAGPATQELGALLGTLDEQRGAVRTLVRRTGDALDALARRPEELRALVRGGDRVLSTTAARATRLRATVRATSGLVRELRATTGPLRRTMALAGPTVRALLPVAPRLASTLRAADAVAPAATRLLRDTPPVLGAARTALPPAERLVRAVGRVSPALDAAGRQLIPLVQLLERYAPDVAAGFPAFASSFQATQGTKNVLRYARQAIRIDSEGYTGGFKQREPSNRSNAYPAPGTALVPTALSCDNATHPATVPATGSQLPCVVAPPWTFNGRTQAFPALTPFAPRP